MYHYRFVLPFPEFCINVIIENMLFDVWLLQFFKIHPCCYSFIADQYSPIWIYHNLLIPFTCCWIFWQFPIWDYCEQNCQIQVFAYMHVSFLLGKYLAVRLLGHMISEGPFNSRRSCQASFQSGGTILHAPQHCIRVPFFPHPHQHVIIDHFHFKSTGFEVKQTSNSSSATCYPHNLG